MWGALKSLSWIVEGQWECWSRECIGDNSMWSVHRNRRPVFQAQNKPVGLNEPCTLKYTLLKWTKAGLLTWPYLALGKFKSVSMLYQKCLSTGPLASENPSPHTFGWGAVYNHFINFLKPACAEMSHYMTSRRDCLNTCACLISPLLLFTSPSGVAVQN